MLEQKKMHRSKLQICVVLALFLVGNAQDCDQLPASGCGGDGPLLGEFEAGVFGNTQCAGVIVISGDDICARSEAEFTVPSCEAVVVPGVFPTPLQQAYCANFIAGCCSTLPTIAPSISPSMAPSGAPSLSPTVPTSFPSNTPSATPSATPSGAPTSIPTGAPVTPGPTTAQLGFFDVEENIYIVAGAGGGGLLLAAAAIVVLVRRRGSSSETSLESSSKGAGGKGGNVAPEDIFDWEKHIDKKSGEVYFFNPKTGESRWDPPPVKGI